MRETSLHPATTEQDGDAALDAGTETLCLLEGSAILVSRAFGGLLASALRDAFDDDACLLASLDVVLAVETSIGRDQSGRGAEAVLVMLESGLDVILIRGVALAPRAAPGLASAT